MFRFAYIIASFKAGILLPLISIFSPKIRRFSAERKNGKKPKTGRVEYWIHCASLGEYEMALPLIEQLLKNISKDKILITIFSPSGYTQAIKGEYADRLMYLPIDTLRKANKFYQEYAPQKAIFIRYDFWYNFIKQGQKRGTSFYLVNGRFQSNHFFFKWFGKPYLNLLRKFKGVYTSDKSSYEILKAHKVEQAQFLGDTRFDRVVAITKSAKTYDDIASFKGDRKLLMLGSSWQPEEKLVAHLLATNPPNLAILIAPHDLKRVDEITESLKKYSPKKYTSNNFGPLDNVLILDTMGMLSSMYQYADFTLIGGGFTGALHNILEPAVWGSHISFGPKTEKFPEAQDFVKIGFATKVSDEDEWVSKITSLINDEESLASLKLKAKKYTTSHIGVTKRIINNIG
ncbi:MAG: hypothetical protein COA58_10250 [Bacteroidetes bacterium]|nr:MAG: hypothetical protein COA58_10250 [Bacteroidota bacterium]